MSFASAQLQDFCRIVQGGRHGLSGNDFVEEGFPAYGAGGLNGYLPTHEFDEPAVILSAIGARCGKCFYADGKWASLANTQLIFPDPMRADPKFLWFQLNDERRWHRSGTGQPFIKPADVKAHRVFLPPLPEQRRIAAILDKADELRARRRAALKKLDELTQSIFLDMFGDPATNPKRWLAKSLDALGDISTGKTPPTSNEGMFCGDIPFATPGDLDTNLESTERTITTAGAAFTRVVRAGSALVGCIGNIGAPRYLVWVMSGKGVEPGGRWRGWWKSRWLFHSRLENPAGCALRVFHTSHRACSWDGDERGRLLGKARGAGEESEDEGYGAVPTGVVAHAAVDGGAVCLRCVPEAAGSPHRF